MSNPLVLALLSSNAERVFLIELEFAAETIYLSTGSRDLFWNSQTWTAVGGNLALGQIEESGDMKGAGVDLILSGVDQSIVATLLAQTYRGRGIVAWQAFLNSVTGEVIDVLQLFEGAQLDSYNVEERSERGSPGTVTIRTRARHRLSADEYRGIQANVHAHQKYAVGDLFFQHVPSISGKKIYWGVTGPSQTGGGGDTGNDTGGTGWPPLHS